MPEEKPKLNLEEIDFLNLVLMLGNTASIELGDKAPKGGEKVFNLPRARQFINMLKVIEKKSEGRRSPQEEEVLKSLLSDLQAKYVKAAGLDQVDTSLGRAATAAYARTKKNAG